MKNRLLQGALLFLITSILLGCNVDASEGIFTRISKSEPVEDVGAVTLIVKDGNVYYALTSQKGLQKYDANQKKWSSIGGTKVRLVSTDGTYIYYAQQETANTLYRYEIGGIGAGNITQVPLPAGYSVIAMSPSFDLMLVKDGNNSYAVCNVSDVSNVDSAPIIGNLSFNLDPQLIVQDATHFIVSGKEDGDTYTHTFYNNSPPKIKLEGDAALSSHPIVAFHHNGTELVAVSSDGTVWEGDPAALSTEGSVPLPDRSPDYLPYPVFHHDDNNKLYLQDANQKFVTISTAGGNLGWIAEATEDFAGQLTTVKIFSFLVGGANIVYAGTTGNGIYEINFTTGLAARL